MVLEFFFGTSANISEIARAPVALSSEPQAARTRSRNHSPAASANPAADSVWKISRFTLNGDVLDKASEKVLFEQKAQRRDCCHTGGGMQFDGSGNLWISMGNNTTNPGDANAADGYVKEGNPDSDDQGHAANTNDLRGKILRIKPTADGKYTIPSGNLFAPGTDKTRPEIYTMGHRSNYSIFVDKYRNWLTWGDIGPDDGAETEEVNLFTSPGNAGWPYFAGAVGHAKYKYRLNKDPAAPVNNSTLNTGITNLPNAMNGQVTPDETLAADNIYANR